MKKIIIFGLMFVLLSSIVFAIIPDVITVQGRLTSVDSSPLSGGYDFTFKLTNIGTGTSGVIQTLLPKTIILDSNGVFNAELKFDDDFSGPRWVEICVVETGGTTNCLKPRVKVTSSGYAYTAAGADNFAVRNKLTVSENIITNGLIGIGTTTPSRELDIARSGDTMFGIKLTRTGGLGDPNSWIIWNMDDNQESYGDDFEIWQYPASGGSLERFTIKDNGNVYIPNRLGVGIETPAEKLHVVGNIKASGTICDSVGCIGSGGDLSCASCTGTDIFNIGNNAHLLSISGDDWLYLHDGSVYTNGLAAKKLYAHDAKIYIDSNGIYDNDGTLTLDDNVKINNDLLINNGGDVNPGSSGTGQFRIGGNGYTGYTALNADAMYIGHNSGLRSLVLQTNEADRLTIDGSGNVDIKNGLTVGGTAITPPIYGHFAGKTSGSSCENNVEVKLTKYKKFKILYGLAGNHMNIIEGFSNGAGISYTITYGSTDNTYAEIIYYEETAIPSSYIGLMGSSVSIKYDDTNTWLNVCDIVDPLGKDYYIEY
ncbi:MAG: hypothetical protein KJ906_02665 [Nanoarchaeota archaeon]|nr:hypothetical protein [Nanoarchaeota archaeon]